MVLFVGKCNNVLHFVPAALMNPKIVLHGALCSVIMQCPTEKDSLQTVAENQRLRIRGEIFDRHIGQNWPGEEIGWRDPSIGHTPLCHLLP